jgi:hypothetical protein
MFQLDGSSDSKPARRPTIMPLRSNTERPRNCVASLFSSSSSKRTESNLSTIDPHNEVIDANSPMRMVSPRATKCEPPNTLRKKQRTLSFKHRKTDKKAKPQLKAEKNTLQPDKAPESSELHVPVIDKTKPESNGLHIPVTEKTSIPQSQDDTSPEVPVVSVGAHIPVTDAPYPCQPRKDSVGLGSPTKETALTSHPVVKAQEADKESEGGFKTPISEIVREYFVRQV